MTQQESFVAVVAEKANDVSVGIDSGGDCVVPTRVDVGEDSALIQEADLGITDVGPYDLPGIVDPPGLCLTGARRIDGDDSLAVVEKPVVLAGRIEISAHHLAGTVDSVHDAVLCARNVQGLVLRPIKVKGEVVRAIVSRSYRCRVIEVLGHRATPAREIDRPELVDFLLCQSGSEHVYLGSFFLPRP